MTDPADRFLAEQYLEGKLHGLARGVSVPVVPTEDDVRRGRRRLFRMRVAMAGATTGTLAFVLGVTSLTAGDPNATEIPEVSRPPSSSDATPKSSPATDPGDDDASDSGRPEGTGSNRGIAALPGGPSSQHTDGGEAPSKNGTNDTATGGSTHDGTISGPHDQPSTHGSEPTEAPSSTVTPSTTPTDSPTSTPTETDNSTPTSTPTATPTVTPTVPPTQTNKVRVHRVLRYYNDVLAEHLDPSRLHLQPYDRKIDSKETKTANGRLYALGSTYRWEDGGSRSGVQLAVASGWDQVDWDCGASYSDWVCHAGPDSVSEFAEHDGVLQLAVEHAGGQVVVLTVDPTYGVDRLGSRDLDSREDDLVAAAADERLILPGVAPVAPPTIDVDAFAAAGVAALVKPGETFDQSGIDRSPWVRGEWVGTEAGGTLAWTVMPIYSRGTFTCLTTYRSCSQVTVDATGTTVHVARLKKKAGGGWLVQYDGDAYGVRVYSSDRKFPKKRAYEFITQPAWQPGS